MKDKKEQIRIDVVCGMDLDSFPGILELKTKDKTFFFCGEGCKDRFKKDPERFQGEPLIRLEKVWKIFDLGSVKIEVLRGLDLHIWEGDFVSIIGASGSGKSTALNMIGLLDIPTSGKIFFKGKDVSLLNEEEKAELRSKSFGFVFQQFNLIPWLSAYENALVPLIFNRSLGYAEKKEKIYSRFIDVGLKDRVTHKPHELSGGEQQRVALVRALANDPILVLGDEPTGNLDSTTGNKILEILTDLNKKIKKTLVVVTHDVDIAEKADQVIVLKDGHLVRDHEAHKKIYTE